MSARSEDKTSKKYGSELNAIKQTVLKHKTKLKRANVDFVPPILDGDEAKWKAIRIECDTMLEKTRRRAQKNTRVTLSIRFKPNRKLILILKITIKAILNFN